MRKLILLLTVVTLSGFFTYAQNSYNTQIKLLKGKELLKALNYTEAAKMFEEILNAEPTQKEAISGAIASYAFLNQLKSAQSIVDKAVAVKSSDPELLVLKGKVLGLRGQFENAIKEFEKASANAQNDTLRSAIFSNMAAMRNQIYKYEDATIDAQKAVSLNDKNSDAYMNLGISLYGTNRFTEAIDNFSLAINLSPDNNQAYYNRGMSYFKTNDKANGCADFQRACKLGNKNGCLQYATECGK